MSKAGSTPRLIVQRHDTYIQSDLNEHYTDFHEEIQATTEE